MARSARVPLPAAKLRLIQVAKRQLAMEDDDYRTLLAAAAGVTSSRELTEAGFRQVMDAFARLGFTSTGAAANFGRRTGFASAGQVATIRRLWADFTAGEGTEATLRQWLEGHWRVSALRFLTAEQAPKVIAALRAMVRRRAGAPRTDAA
jgi:hypothetical protein